MPDDLYAPPAMWLYVRDLIADTADLTNEEFGAYVRLLLHQWREGSIPSDSAAQSRICGRIRAAAMKGLRKAIGDRLRPIADGSLQSRRMEEVRNAQFASAELYRERAKTAANSRWRKRDAQALLKHAKTSTNTPPNDDASDAQALLKHKPGDASSNAQAMLKHADGKSKGPVKSAETPETPSSDDAQALLKHETDDAQALLEQCFANCSIDPEAAAVINISTPARDPRSPAWKFAQFVLTKGLEAEVIPPHVAIDPHRWVHGEIDSAETLVNAYGVTECESRAERMIALKKRNRLRRSVTVGTLAAVWDWAEISGAETGVAGPTSDAMKKAEQYAAAHRKEAS